MGELYRRAGVVALAILWLAGAASPQPGSQAAERIIKAGDALQITVVNNAAFTQVAVVTPEGRIHYPFFADENVIGWKFTELEDRITRRLAGVLQSAPYVIVDDAQYYTIRISLLGQILHPGFLEAPHGSDLQGAIAMAGGPTANADLTNVQVQRVSQDGIETITVNVEKFVYEGRLGDLIRMQEGDVVIVKGAPEADKIKVFGEVNKSGSYVRPYGATVLDMIYLAGGTTDYGTLSDVRWLRKVGDRIVEEKLDLAGLLRAGRTDEIPMVGQGDVIIVQKRLLTYRTVLEVITLVIQFLTVRELLRRW